MPKGIKLSEDEKAFIMLNHSILTIAEVAERLNRPKDSIWSFCKRNKIRCKVGVWGGHPRKVEKSPGIIKRPPPVYTNSPTPFGIADELHRNPMSFCSAY